MKLSCFFSTNEFDPNGWDRLAMGYQGVRKMCDTFDPNSDHGNDFFPFDFGWDPKL